MLTYASRRVVGAIPVLFMVALIVFALVQAAPGDPIDMLLSDEASAEERAQAREQWGLDRPWHEQFFSFVANAVRGDFGESFRYGEEVMVLILERLPASLELALSATLFAVLIGVPLGVWAASRPNSWIDNLSSMGGFSGISMPNFWFALLLILLFSGYLNLLPSSGRISWGIGLERITGFLVIDSLLQGRWDALWESLKYLALPTVVLGTNMMGIIMQITRASVIETLKEDYVMTARAKGMSRRVVLWRHAFRNAMISVITIIGLEFGTLISGAIIVETVFSWPGIGYLLLQGITYRDFPLVMALVLTYTMIFVLINLVIDLLYKVVDPRIKVG